MRPAAPKRYDRSYFDRWYRNPKFRVGSAGALSRRVSLCVAAAEAILERPLESVLDVGCGEGAWRGEVKRRRPRARYVGLDPSPYVVARFGASRGVRSGSFGSLGAAAGDGPFDLVVCADVLHYVADAEVEAGLPSLAVLTGGVAFLSVFSLEDRFVGDRDGWKPRPSAWYRARFAAAGFVPLGLHLHASPAVSGSLSALEGPPPPPPGRPPARARGE